MIERSELERLARLNHLEPYQQEKHYIQNVVLSSIANESANELVFKGGTALWLFYGLNRFSEDLDFTAVKPANYAHLMAAVESQLAFRNIRAAIRKTETIREGVSFRIGAEGPLFEEEKHRCFVKVEISGRADLVLEPRIKTYVPPYNDLAPFSVRCMDTREILAEKVRAVLSRDKARDIYDLWFLLRKGAEMDYTLIAQKTKSEGPFRRRLLDRIKKTEKTWRSGLEWMIFGPLPPFDQILRDIEAALAETKE